MSSQYPVIDLEENEQHPVIDLEEAPSKKKKPYFIHEEPYKTLPRLGMQGQIGGLGLITGGPEFGLQTVENLSRGPTDQENIVSQKISPVREFVQGMPEAPYKQLGFETEPQTYAEEMARKAPGIFALVASAPTLLSSIGKGIMSYLPAAKTGLPIAKAGVPPPGGGVPPPGGGATTPSEFKMKGLIPEHEFLEKTEPILGKIEAETKSPIPEKPEFKFGKPTPPTTPKADIFKLNEEVGRTFSNTSIPDMTMASKAVRNEINAGAGDAYEETQRLWANARLMNAGIEGKRPLMAQKLQRLVDEISLAKEPSSVQKDVRKIAAKYVRKRKIGNENIIAQIKSNNQKINHDYMQGVPSNVYSHLNDILIEGLEEAKGSEEAINAYNEARGATRSFKETYGRDEVLPWRNPSVSSHVKLLKGIENPDQLASLQPLLSRTPKGQALYNAIRRDFIQNRFKPYIENPEKIGDISFDKMMRELRPITTPEERNSLSNIFERAKEPYQAYERQKAFYEDRLSKHKLLENNFKRELRDWENHVKGLKEELGASYNTDAKIKKGISSVRELKKLENYLNQSEEGKELIPFIRDYISSRLLTNGKILIDAKAPAKSLRRIFNDVDDRAMLEHAYGKEVVDDLKQIVNKPEVIDKNVQTLRLIKNIGKLTPGIGPFISRGDAIYDIWTMFRPAINAPNYETIDMELIQKIIDSRKLLLNPKLVSQPTTAS